MAGSAPDYSPEDGFLGIVISTLLMIICAAAQTTWPSWLRLYGQVPDLTLGAVICVGLCTGANSGLQAGFLGAFFWGAVSSSPWGNLFLSHMGLGLVAGSLRGRVFADRISIAVLLVALGEVLASIVQLLLAPPPSPQAWFGHMLMRALYSGLLAVPLYLLVRALRRHYPEPEVL